MAVFRPEMWAMPSPTSVTTEASWWSTVALIALRLARRVSRIFCELMVSSVVIYSSPPLNEEESVFLMLESWARTEAS